MGRRVWWAWFLGVCLGVSCVTGCGMLGPPDEWVELPPVEQPPTPPVQPPPPVTPPVPPTSPIPPTPPAPTPATIAALLERIPIGATEAAVIAAVGSPPEAVPQNPNSAYTRRWYVAVDGVTYLVFVAFDAAGLSVRKGAARVENVR